MTKMPLPPKKPNPVEQLFEKWETAKARNSALALKDLEALAAKGLDVSDCQQALEDYRDIDRSDYDEKEEYQDARDEAWGEFLTCLDNLSTEWEEDADAMTVPKEPWQMTKSEYAESLKAKSRILIEAWNKAGSHGVPPTAQPSIYEVAPLAVRAGYVMPRDAEKVLQKSYHRLQVEAAIHEGKPVPPEVLKDYPDLASKSLPVKTKREQIMEFDYAHTLDELKKMAREKGVSPSGTKHAIIARMI